MENRQNNPLVFVLDIDGTMIGNILPQIAWGLRELLGGSTPDIF